MQKNQGFFVLVFYFFSIFTKIVKVSWILINFYYNSKYIKILFISNYFNLLLFIMKLVFQKKWLDEIRYTGYRKTIPAHITKGYIRTITFFQEAKDMRDLYNHTSFHCEQIGDKKNNLYTVRVNDWRRVFFNKNNDWTITILEILDLNNHDYKKFK